MNELQNADMRTPIEIALDIDSDGMTTARKLYAFLELSPSNYSKWCKTNILENEFADENVDYWAFVLNDEWGGQATTDYKLTAHFAKKLSVKGNSEKSEQAREYFTTVEEKVKQKAIDIASLSPQLQSLYGLIETQARQELEQKRLAKEVAKVKQSQNAIAETFAKANNEEDFQRWVNTCITRIAQSPYFCSGMQTSVKYSMARSESYDRLTKKRNCRLDDRVQRAKGRALEEKPSIKKTDLNKINKLSVITSDKDLKPAYELVIKEMMMCYCAAN
jgi:anti-repressor protein